MAHTVVGIDLGASAVKFVLLEVGFRHTRFLRSFEEPVPAGDAPLADRQGEALAAGLANLSGETTAFVALPGDMLAVRILDLPFSDPRKIDQVVGYELEGQIVHALQDVVFDHAVLRPRGEGSSVLAAAARTDEVADFLAAVGVRGVDPRALFAAPLVYHTLFPGPRRTEAPAETCRLLLDLGARRVNVCFVAQGETIYARALTRGGDTLTAAIARAAGLGPAEAEQAKRQHGFVASARRPAMTRGEQQMDAVLREALTPLLRDLRQTLASFRAHDKRAIESLLLTGGGAALTGLAEYLEEELEIPVMPWAPEVGGGAAAEAMDPAVDPAADAIAEHVQEAVAEAGAGRFALAAAIAWAGARGQKEIDLRRGPFVYRASFSVLRQKAVHLGVLAAALLVAATVDGTMALARLTKQKERLEAQLRTGTQELFGEARMDAKAVAALLKRGFKEEMAALPKATAFDLLNEISRRTPSSERIKLDILDLDIRPKKTTMKGTVDSAAAVDEMVTRLKEIECFEEINKGPITESGGAKNFSLTIASKCP